MKPYEFKRFYHPKFGRFVYQHKGSGLIVDNIFKPLRKVASNVFKMAKPVAKKAIHSGISKAGEKMSKKASEKAGDMIRKRLSSIITNPIKNSTPKTKTAKPMKRESTNMIINRLISGNGFRR